MGAKWFSLSITMIDSRRTSMKINMEIDIMNFKPLGNRVVVEVEEVTTTRTGIILPGTLADKPLEGTIVAVGTKLKEDVNVGDLITYGKYSGTEIEVDDIKYLIMSVDDIFGIKSNVV